MACKNRTEARKFVSEVVKLAKKYKANFFIVTDGASAVSMKDIDPNDNSNAIANARNSQIEWEKKYGFDPDEDWSKNEKIGKEDFDSIDEKFRRIFV